jgi:RNA polymerase sigma factor (sigma-70 family)
MYPLMIKNRTSQSNSDDEFLRQQLEKMMADSRYSKNCQDYWNRIALLFNGDVSKLALYKYIGGRINKLNLHNIDPRDVLVESIIRGIEYINKHQKPIDNPTAWLRVTATNILLEKVKEIKRCYQWSDDLDRIDFSGEREDIESFSENPSEALQAFRSLSESEQRIIIYRLFHHKKYSEINEITCYRQYSEVAIRKQYSRAIQNLRKAFKQIVPDFLL